MATTPTVWKSLTQLNPTGTGSQSDAAIIDIGLGRYVAVWTEAAGGPIAIDSSYPGSDLVGQIFDAEGNAIGGEFQVNWSRNVDDEQDAALAPRVGGGFAVVYEDTDVNGTSIIIDFFNIDGVHQTSSAVNATAGAVQEDGGTDTLANPSVAMNANGSYLVTYERSDNAGDTDIVGRIFTEGGALGSEFVIFDQDDDTTNPQVAALSDGNFVVVFQDEFLGDSADFDVRAAIVSEAGSVVGSTFVVVNEDANEDDPHVAALTGGGFVVVWRDDDGDGAGNPGIKARIYNNSGDPHAAGAFSVNTTTAGNQSDPEVAALADGGFVVVWTDSGSGLIRGQRFDFIGDKVGSEFTQNFSVEDNPVVAALSDGRFIVGFEDVDNAPTDIDIHATIFDPRTSPLVGDNNDNVITSRQDGAEVYGLGGSDTLFGQSADDRLDGGTGSDTMLGRAGDDTYFVDNTGDAVIESAGQGTDTVASSVSFVLGANVENLVLTGSANINGTGNGLANVIVGNAGKNTLSGGDGDDALEGGLGADTMSGGTGDDAYFVDNAGDVVNEAAGAGTDTVVSSITYALGDTVENLLLTGSAKIDGTGNKLANILVGNAGKNKLDGGKGSDIIAGGEGKDKLLGKAGKDTFVFMEAIVAGNADKLKDFKHKKDTIFLDEDLYGALGPSVSKKEFTTGKKAGDKNDFLIQNKNKIYYDADGKGGAKQVLIAKVGKKVKLDHKDFAIGDPDLLAI